MTGPRTTPETRQEIIQRYQAGETAPTLARQLNLSVDTIKRHLRQAGVPLRDDRRGTGPTRTADRIAAAGTTTRHIRNWARTAGIHAPAAGQLPDTIIDAYLAAHDNPNQEGTTP